MRLLIVGVGALGGVIGAKLVAAGVDVSFATRDRRTADQLRACGIRVGDLHVEAANVRALDDWSEPFDVVMLATKADDALKVGVQCARLGTLLPIQNGLVSSELAEQLPSARVIGCVSNLGATMVSLGVYEQRNNGHLLLDDAPTCDVLSRGIDARLTSNIRGAMWSKLLINCSVTTLGAIAGTTMRGYITEARALFDATYDEALAVARAANVQLQRMVVEPEPPPQRDAWMGSILATYGDLQPSMLQDIRRGRPTEIDSINGVIVTMGRRLNIPVPINEAIVERVHAISRGETTPSLMHLRELLRTV